MTQSDLERPLWSIMDLLRDYADDLVLVGGWVPYLQMKYGRAGSPGVRTSRTGEADLVLPSGLRRGDRRPIVELLEEAGFEPLEDARVVWARDPEHGEKIEFFQPHSGTARSRGRPTRPPEQPGLGALALDHLWIMERFTEPLLIPGPEAGSPDAPVRVPLLGAYVLNKANTFNLRSGPDAPLKAGKDLLYLRDIMAAGRQAERVVEEDLEAMLADDANGRVKRELDRAHSHLHIAAHRYYGEAARILAEREGLDEAAARADVEGHVRDLTDLLAEDASPDH